MLSENQAIKATSHKIKAISKILPFLMSEQDTEAVGTLLEFIQSHLKVEDTENEGDFVAQFKA